MAKEISQPTPIPVGFDDLLGLRRAKATLRKVTDLESGVQSVLLYGSDSIGKSTLARFLTRFWLANDPTAGAVDAAAESFDRGTNPDFLRIAPSGLSALIKVSQIVPGSGSEEEKILSMTEFLQYLPLRSRNKVVLIEDAHRMNDQSSNALLKPLEEPRPYARIILTTSSIASIKPTILSRCLAIGCDMPTDAELAAAFPNVPSEIVQMSEGAPGKISRFLKNVDLYLQLAKFLDGLIGARPSDALRLSEQFRHVCEGVGEAENLSARVVQAHILAVSATYLARSDRFPAAWVHRFIEAHRLVLQNGSATIIFDTLFTSLAI